MTQLELDSFYVKFKNLLRAGKDASLTIKSESGRAVVSLSVDLGHVFSEPGLHHPQQPRNGPGRQRRREKRAANRKWDAENATYAADEVEPAEEVPIKDEAVKTNNNIAEQKATAGKSSTDSTNLNVMNYSDI